MLCLKASDGHRETQNRARPHDRIVGSAIKTNRTEAVNIDEIPTPETTFRYEADKYTGGFSAYKNMRDHAIDLERRLTIARDGFKELINAIETGSFSNGEYSRCEIKQAKETLTQTAPTQ